MSRKTRFFAALFMSCLLAGCTTTPQTPSDPEPDPEPPVVEPDEEDFSDYEEVSQGSKMLFPRQNSKVGDPMPFYEDGVLFCNI